MLSRLNLHWKPVVFAIIGVIVATASADADLVSTTYEDFATLTSDFSVDGAASASTTLLVDQFDPSLGTLTAVEIRTFGGTTGTPNSVFIRNTDTTTARRFVGDVNLQIGMTGPVISPYALDSTQHVAPFSTTPPDSTILVNLNTGSGVNEDFFDAVSLAAFTGVGQLQYDVSFATFTQQTDGDIGFFEASPNLNVTAGITVTYHFEPLATTPEPSGLLLAMTGGIGLCGTRWRRRKSAGRESVQ